MKREDILEVIDLVVITILIISFSAVIVAMFVFMILNLSISECLESISFENNFDIIIFVMSAAISAAYLLVRNKLKNNY